MKVYRLTQKKYSESPFDPIGAKTHGGRWNSKGTEALYFSESESLCSLEVLVHVSKHPEITNLYDLYSIELPETLVARLSEEDLPSDWRAMPASESTQEVGDQFLSSENKEYVALQVPSVISPNDKNYIVNPNHDKVKDILEGAEKLDFEFDLRIFK